MPILKKEIDRYPDDLLADPEMTAGECGRWWALYTRSRREKELMRRLIKLGIAFYCPVIEQQHRSPNGRLRTSHIPLFSNYVFLRGDENDRYAALTTSCISRDIEVPDPERLVHDLCKINTLIAAGRDLTPEARIETGTRVRVKTGALAGQVGTVIERRGQRRLLVAVDFLQQGASAELTSCDLEILSP
ncbi:MAG: UpxY family transcription antiterminator [Planctomycetaceae bacterium]|nr:UpxY family transcription antiterminator [Planctomycetaceae bacterium]